MTDVFLQDFWIDKWKKDIKSDVFNVHKGYATSSYWDKASETYNKEKKKKDLRYKKLISLLEAHALLFENMKVLDIGCGPGNYAIKLAEKKIKVTALDFSEPMLKRLETNTSLTLKKNIKIVCSDWHKINIIKKGWEKKFDLVLALMSPGVSTPEAFFKMMRCAKKACAISGWAARQNHPVLSALWKKIMKTPLNDKPQSIFYKINLLFCLGFYPDIAFDKVKWTKKVSLKQEFESQMAFFTKVSKKSSKNLEKIIYDYLITISKKNNIFIKRSGVTATAVWRI